MGMGTQTTVLCRRSAVPFLVLVLVPVLAALSFAACGSGAGDEDPEEVLQQTFNGDGNVDSAVLDVTVDASISGDDADAIAATLTGPFESAGENELPLIDLALDAKFGRDEIDAGVTATGEQAFVTVDGQAYAIDEATFTEFREIYRQSAESAPDEEDAEESSALLSNLGINPASWLIDLTNEGTEDLDGVETIHVSGTADIGQIVADAQSLAEATGEATGIGPAVINDLESAVTSASVDVYTGADDKILRLLELDLELTDPETEEQIALALRVELQNINGDQEIVAPANTKPIDELIPGGLGAVGAVGGGSGGGGQIDPSDLSGPDEKYLDCLAQAQGSPEEINDCAKLLG